MKHYERQLSYKSIRLVENKTNGSNINIKKQLERITAQLQFITIDNIGLQNIFTFNRIYTYI